MLYNVYTIKDELAGEAGPPFIAVNDKVAMRNFNKMGIPEALIKEYTLLKIGYFDSIDISITPNMVYTITKEENDNEPIF